jgi:hypothetical protein
MTASAYIDRQLDEVQADEYRNHLAICSDCHLHLVEIESASLMLRDVSRPEVPRELRGYVMTEIDHRRSPNFGFPDRLLNWLIKLNPRVVAYATGLVMSLASFGVLFSTFKPIPVPVNEVEQVAIYPIVNGSNREFHSYNNLPPDTGSADDEQYYQLPRVLPNDSGLVSFSHIAYSSPGSETMRALVEIGIDGRGKLLDVIDAPKDPFVIEQLWWSLRNRTFQPAIVSGRAVPTRIILLVEKVDISG